MSASNSSTSGPTATRPASDGSATGQEQRHPMLMFFMPPPPTFFVQFGNGVQMTYTPSPAQYLHAMMSGQVPSGSGSGDAANGGGAFMRAMNELFQRAQSEQHGPPPTSKPFLDKLPVKTWTPAMTTTEKHTECVICLSDYEKDEKVLSLPCGHTFHKDCGMPWLVEHNVCPTCRHQLPTQADATAETMPESAPTRVTTVSRAAQTEPQSEPEQEPGSEDTDASSSVTGVRRRPDVESHEREVRQRVEDHRDNLPGAVTSSEEADDAELDHLLEKEADRFVQEEKAKRETTTQALNEEEGVEFDDVDVEELLRETC